jgi:hypothetical protein
MRDIVATIQPEQYDVVSADLDQTICVQGAPGTGKTAVGLHRAAYLLHAHRTRLARSGVLVVGPNHAFMHYIGQVLPALGEVEVRQVTVAELVEGVPVRSADPSPAAALKGDPRMAEVIRRAVWRHVQEPTDALVVPRGTRRWRVPAHEVGEAIEALRQRHDPYSSAARCCPNDWPTWSCSAWRRVPRSPTTACRTQWPALGRSVSWWILSGRHSTRSGW